MDGLIILNIIAVITILIVSIINICLSIIKHKEYRRNFNFMQSNINYAQQNINMLAQDLRKNIKYKLEKQTINILDLDEFKDLDINIKDIYKKQIVNTLMPSIMSAINDKFILENVDSELQNNSNQINKIIKELANEIKTNGLSMPEIYYNISDSN
jgi:cysteinyl-tRNA synthetase